MDHIGNKHLYPESRVIAISSGESDASTDSSSDESDVGDRTSRKLTIRGPNVMGSDTYDPYCVFPNRVALDHAQVAFLKKHCAEHKPTKPLYVCTMQDSNVIEGKGKMYFNKSYTNTYLKRYLSKATKVQVYCNKIRTKKVRIKIGKSK